MNFLPDFFKELASLNFIQKNISPEILKVIESYYYRFYGNEIISLLILLIILGILRGFVKKIQMFIHTKTEGKVSKRSLANEARKYIKAGEYVKAAEIYESIGDMDSAYKTYFSGQNKIRAYEILEGMGKHMEAAKGYEDIGEYEKAAVLYEKQKHFNEAESCYVKADKILPAAGMFETAGNFDKAGEYFEKSLRFTKAAEMFLKSGKFLKAAGMYEKEYAQESERLKYDMSKDKLKDLKETAFKGAEGYIKGGEVEKAARLLHKAAFYKEAGERFLEAGKIKEAAESFLDAKESLKAADLFESVEDVLKANKIRGDYYKGRGEELFAAEAYEKAQEYSDAGDIYKNFGDYLRAAKAYESGGESSFAAEMYEMSGDDLGAAMIYEASGNFLSAYRCYEKNGELLKSAEMLEKGEEYLKAGKLYRNIGVPDKSIEVLQKVEPSLDDYIEASEILSDIFLEIGERVLALKRLEEIVKSQVLDVSIIEILYKLAVLKEEDGNPDEAKSLYEKISTLSYGYKDVNERLLKFSPQKTLSEKVRTKDLPSRFELNRLIKEVDFGTLYAAYDNKSGKNVAYLKLKEIFLSSKELFKLLTDEARKTAGLPGRYVIRTLSAGKDNENLYLALEQFEGESFDELIKKYKVFTAKSVLNISLRIASLLSDLEKNGFFFGPLILQNIILTPQKDIRFMFYGFSKSFLLLAKKDKNLNYLKFAAPEESVDILDNFSDYYKFGMLIKELFAGKVPDGFIQITEKCLSRNKSERFKSFDEIISALKIIKI